MEPDYEAADEKCLVRLQNYREPVNHDVISEPAAVNNSTMSKDHHQSKVSVDKGEADGSQKMETVSDTSSQRATRQIDNFEIEKLSQKVILLRPQAESFEGTLMLQHNEAVYFIRRHIIEKAKLFWKEGKDVHTNHVLGLTSVKQKAIDEAYEKQCIDTLGYALGEQYEDQNMRVTFKTFLQQDDKRLEE